MERIYTMEEGNRRTKFVELAEKRVTRAIKDIRLIGNLSNRTNYSYDEEDVRKIMSGLQNEIRLLKKRFDSLSSPEEFVFSLSDREAETPKAGGE